MFYENNPFPKKGLLHHPIEKKPIEWVRTIEVVKVSLMRVVHSHDAFVANPIRRKDSYPHRSWRLGNLVASSVRRQMRCTWVFQLAGTRAFSNWHPKEAWWQNSCDIDRSILANHQGWDPAWWCHRRARGHSYDTPDEGISRTCSWLT